MFRILSSFPTITFYNLVTLLRLELSRIYKLAHFIEFAHPPFQNQRMSDSRVTLPFPPLIRQGEAKKYNDQLLLSLLVFFRKTIKIIFPQQLLEQN